MKRMITIAATAIICASQVSALSCMRPDVARTFQWAAEADEAYVALFGSFAFDAPAPVPSADINFPIEHTMDAVFTGQTLGATQFQDNAPLDVTITFDCLGPWCGSLPDDGTPMLAFVQQTEDGYALIVGPCFDTAFVSPTPEDVARVEACMRGEACEEMPLR